MSGFFFLFFTFALKKMYAFLIFALQIFFDLVRQINRRMPENPPQKKETTLHYTIKFSPRHADVPRYKEVIFFHISRVSNDKRVFIHTP